LAGRGRDLLINLNLSRRGDFLGLLLQRTILLALASALSLQLSPHSFLAVLGIASLDGNPGGWQLCACYAWGESSGFLKAHCLWQQQADTLSSLGDVSGRYVVVLSLGG